MNTLLGKNLTLGWLLLNLYYSTFSVEDLNAARINPTSSNYNNKENKYSSISYTFYNLFHRPEHTALIHFYYIFEALATRINK